MVYFILVTIYFNSRPHKEVDKIIEKFKPIIKISTHDLTRRSTMQNQNMFEQWKFQLTTSQGGRRCGR